ncbi:MAG: condensation domain-containing protein, partial [Tepidiformaceae bacterium]
MKAETIERIYQLSPLQEGILFHTLHAPGSGMYVEQFSFTVGGDIDITSLERAWQAVVNRHAVLRTSFHWRELDKPLQVVHREVKLPFDRQDWLHLPAEAQQDRLTAFLRADRERGFSLSEAPLLRLVVIRLAPVSWQLVLSFHHVLLDGWSVAIVFREAAALYQAYGQGQELRLEPTRPFEDYIAWLQEQDVAGAEAFWRRMLEGYRGPAPISVDRAAGRMPDPDERYASREAKLSRETTAALQGLARTHQLTLNTLIQGAWAVLLSRYTGNENVVFGATVSGRPMALTGVESMVGLFINTLPVRVQVDPDAPLLPWLKDLQRLQFEARQFEHTPLVQIHACSAAPRGVPLFETLLGFENFPVDMPQQTDGGAVESRYFGQTNYPLTLIVAPADELWVKLMHACPRFEPDTITRLLGHFEQLLTTMAENPARRLGELGMLTAAERRELAAWNATDTSYPREATIHGLFEEQA